MKLPFKEFHIGGQNEKRNRQSTEIPSPQTLIASKLNMVDLRVFARLRKSTSLVCVQRRKENTEKKTKCTEEEVCETLKIPWNNLYRSKKFIVFWYGELAQGQARARVTPAMERAVTL